MLEEIEFAFDCFGKMQALYDDCLFYDAEPIKGSGRIEKREIYLMPADKALSKDSLKKWDSVKTIIKVVNHKRFIRNGKLSDESTEIHYYISSIAIDNTDELFASKMLNVVLDRWGIEGTQHFTLDVLFEQDSLPLRNRQYIENHSFFTKLSFNVISYVRNNLPEIYTHKVNFSDLADAASQDIELGFEFLHAYFTDDMSSLLENEKMYKYGLIKRPKVTVVDDSGIFTMAADADSPLAKLCKTKSRKRK